MSRFSTSAKFLIRYLDIISNQNSCPRSASPVEHISTDGCVHGIHDTKNVHALSLKCDDKCNVRSYVIKAMNPFITIESFLRQSLELVSFMLVSCRT